MIFQGWRKMAASIGVVCAIAAMAACGAQSRYKVLSFFFDGVPPPPGYVSPNASSPDGNSTSSTLHERLAAGRGVPRPKPTVLPIVSTHPATEGTRSCQMCHDAGRGLKAMDKETKICDRCHSEMRKKGGWNHGPINLGNCLPCHRAHGSPYPHLLDKPVPDLCMDCHSENEPGEKMKHDFKNMTPELRNCLECHNPHKVK